MSLIDSIISAESGGNATARNPNSSATGAAQFIESTWLDMLAKNRPDLTGSREELLALRNDPRLSAEMAEAYANSNNAILSKNGLPVTAGTTYLAHFAGPQGAVSVLQADPGAPVSSVLSPDAMKANPFLAKMTVGDLRAWADRKMGGSSPSAQPAPATPAAAPAGLLAPQASMGLAPIFPAQGALQPQQAPQQQGGGYFDQMPAQMQAPPLIFPKRQQIDLSRLRAALQRPPVFRG